MQTQETQQNRAVRSVRISVFPCFLFLSAQMYTHAAVPVALVFSLMMIMTVILRNSCKVKPIQPMQKEPNGKDEHHLDHATDEEKLASSVGLRSEKEESGG
ncbi:hypothetical protein D4764_05G0004530 [Takifugu flavidus]|uniref:Uncharacterized protein n=1 Tax=Takifugu flavidus TaxID=433684 RepID=A0A5C6MZD2_9TELE|nr:hypothetical protein D4764_05G0004530 [Takifugu flavidus]